MKKTAFLKTADFIFRKAKKD